MNLEIEDFNTNDPWNRYYVVGVDGADVEGSGVSYYDEQHPEISRWCKATFGVEDLWGRDPQSGWKRLANKYYFTQEEMRSMFVLRWL